MIPPGPFGGDVNQGLVITGPDEGYDYEGLDTREPPRGILERTRRCRVDRKSVV